jgi:hypothetical protein
MACALVRVLLPVARRFGQRQRPRSTLYVTALCSGGQGRACIRVGRETRSSAITRCAGNLSPMQDGYPFDLPDDRNAGRIAMPILPALLSAVAARIRPLSSRDARNEKQ